MAGLQADDAAYQAKAEAANNDAINEKDGIYGSDDHHQAHVATTTASDDALSMEGYPNEEERATLRRVPGSIPWSSFLIAFVELVERFSYYGTTVVFTNFIQNPLPVGSTTGKVVPNPNSQARVVPGALGQGQQASTGLTTFNTFWVYCVPLLGAYVADVHLGRYNTIMVAIVVALVGHVLLVISSIPSMITNPNGSLACFCVAIIVMGLGTGGFKPNISPLVAETIEAKQKHMHVKTVKSGETVIVDPTLTISRIYMWFYLAINIGALVGQIGMAYSERNVGFWLAYLLPTALFCLCPAVMMFGRKLYVRRPPTGSIFAQSMKLWTLAMKGRWTLNPVTLWKNLNAPDFWERTKPSNIPAASRPGWMHFDDAWVDEVRRGFKACKVFLWFPLYWLSYNQINNNLTSQAGVMNTHGLPNDVLSNLDPFALIILIPVFDMFFYPLLRKAGINFSPLKKITLGFFSASLAMVSAAVVQHYIYQKSPCGYDAGSCREIADFTVWAQTPSYVLIAISEIFASITGLEYAFTLAPKSMRSLVMSVFLFTSGVSAAIGEAFNPLSADPYLVWNYGSFAVIAFVASILFWYCHRGLDKQHEEMLALREGQTGQDQGRKVLEVDNKL